MENGVRWRERKQRQWRYDYRNVSRDNNKSSKRSIEIGLLNLSRKKWMKVPKSMLRYRKNTNTSREKEEELGGVDNTYKL